MFYPNFNQAKEIISEGAYTQIPVSLEIFSDIKTPIEVLKVLKNISKHCFMLESVEDSKKWGRYTLLGFEPTLEITCRNNELQVSGEKNFNIKTNKPNEYIRKILSENVSPRIIGLPPFTGGLVGYFSFDYIKYVEPTLNLYAQDDENLNDADLMLFDKVIAFDNFKQKIVLIVNAKVKNFEHEYLAAQQQLLKLKELIQNGEQAVNPKPVINDEFKPLFSKAQYCEMVEKAKEYICEGDIFQVVLSNRLEAQFSGSLLDAYRVLRTTNPSPYMFYFSSDEIEITGASPETLVKLENKKLHTFPLAGTRPRGKSDTEDLELERELLTDKKELAEHNMLVDLGRNDIGKISKIGSVNVEKYLSIERFSHVMHIGSTVTGEIADQYDALDAIDAILPAGTLSGAPKIKACQIINDLENNKRGIYGGAIGYIDFAGNLDTCIAIRLAFAKNGKVFVRSGAGIVKDSVAEKEHEECINKAKAVVKAIEIAQEGIS